ncbi:MAG: hypothetical protein IPK26_13180 [Planctomycetes bacterium]|nr:hypothetical protein [Planctomycetota bacterium]
MNYPGIAIVPFVLALASAQRTLVVDSVAGPYIQITAAIAAAQPGDRVEVHPSAVAYDGFAVSIGVDIVAPLPDTRVAWITIANVASDHGVRVDGLVVRRSSRDASVCRIVPA